MVLATKTYNSALQWVQIIYEAATYAHKNNGDYAQLASSNIKTIEIVDEVEGSKKEGDDASSKKDKDELI